MTGVRLKIDASAYNLLESGRFWPIFSLAYVNGIRISSYQAGIIPVMGPPLPISSEFLIKGNYQLYRISLVGKYQQQ